MLTLAAAADDPAADCNSPDPDRKIRGCTALIQSGQIDPGALSDAHNKRGIAYVVKGYLERAFWDFSTAIRHNPTDPKAYVNRGGVYMQWGRRPEAMINYDKAIQLDPNFARAYANRGLVHFFDERYTAALADMNNAIRLDPSCALTYNNRGVVFENLGQHAAAIVDFMKALELDPDLEVARSNLMRLTRGASTPPESGSSMVSSNSDMLATSWMEGGCPI